MQLKIMKFNLPLSHSFPVHQDALGTNGLNGELTEGRFPSLSQLTFTCSKSTIETLEKGVKYV